MSKNTSNWQRLSRLQYFTLATYTLRVLSVVVILVGVWWQALTSLLLAASCIGCSIPIKKYTTWRHAVLAKKIQAEIH